MVKFILYIRRKVNHDSGSLCGKIDVNPLIDVDDVDGCH
jgi:hypothetical protein